MAAAATAPVVIIGGGFGGLYTALALADQNQHPPILLIEPQDRFLFLPLLYELLSHELRSWEIAPRFDALLAGRGVAWLQDSVVEIDHDVHEVSTATGRRLAFSQAVIATGSTTQTYGIAGAAEHCLGFRSLADVRRLQQLITQLRQRSRPLQRLAVVGAGASGVELACKLADELGGCAVVELLEQGAEVLPQARAFNREQALLALQRKDVRVRTQTAVTAVAADHLLLGPNGERLSVDAVIWTAGIRCQAPALRPTLQRDRRGRLHCSPQLQVVGASDLFALGDVAALEEADTTALPSNAQVALQQAGVVADNLMRARRGEPLKAFAYNDLGEMMSLGRQEASITAAGVTLAGRAAYELRRLAYLTRLPGRSHRLKVAAGWLAEG